MYAKFSHVLTSGKNIEILTSAVKDLSKAKHIDCTKNEVDLALQASLLSAIEDNVMVAKYLTSAHALYDANQYIVAKALKSLQDKKSIEIGGDVISQKNESKRKEVAVSDRSLQVQQPEEEQVAKITPRSSTAN
jgi:hypothetical protein